MRVKEVARRVFELFFERDLPTYASAIAFQALFALLPLCLAALALLGFLGLEEVWRDDLSERVEENMSDDAFEVIDRTVESILTERRGLWLTFGAAFAVWQVSSVVRAASGALNLIYGVEEQRSTPKRLAISLALALGILPAFAIAVVSSGFGDRIVGALGLGLPAEIGIFVGRWAVTIALLLAVVWLILYVLPRHDQRGRYVTMGAAVVVLGWIVSTLAYVWYITNLADYENVFGSLAAGIVAMSYFYLLAIVFLAGVQLDAVLRERMDGGSSR